MRVATIPISDARWWDFVSSHPAAGPLHLPAWTEVIAACYGFRCFALTAFDADDGIAAGIPVVEVRLPARPVRWVALPFSDSCSLLVRADVDEDAVVAAMGDHALASGARELEVRWSLPAGARRHPVQAGYQHRIELPADPAGLHPRKSYRNLRNAAQRAGIVVTRGTAPSDVSGYYRMHTATRRRLGVPVQPRRFFDLIGKRLLGEGHGFVATASLDGEPLASCLCLGYNGTLLTKFGASATGRSDTGAGHLLDWDVMATACVDGYRTLDFGRTDTDADGLRLYKTGWGAVEEPLVYTHISDVAPTSQHQGVGGLARGIIRTTPSWVARGVGEVLYRWTA